ncbi:MAG TPA: diguanylate cyclase, partial [Pseudohaliea sp.]|nr:diguanylate cyclase [Pseudohaliea sp.]
DARLQDARRALEEVRARFATMDHGAVQGEFRVTFSAGIAGYPDITRPLRLVLAADRALYAAKRAGRDRVVVAKVGQQAA